MSTSAINKPLPFVPAGSTGWWRQEIQNVHRRATELAFAQLVKSGVSFDEIKKSANGNVSVDGVKITPFENGEFLSVEVTARLGGNTAKVEITLDLRAGSFHSDVTNSEQPHQAAVIAQALAKLK